MINIVGESMKTGLIIEVLKKFPGTAIYKESISAEPIFPHFFLQQLTLNYHEDRKNSYWFEYLMNIRYRQLSDPVLEPNLQMLLDGTGLKMLEMSKIGLGELLIPIRRPRIEKLDGVLHYFCNFIIQLTKKEIDEIEKAKQWHLDLIIDIKGGN